MLKLVLEKGLSNIVVVVTRYFGGTLLGTGGLVRAYSDAVEKALEQAEIIQKTKGYQSKIQVDYNNAEQLKYYLEKNKIKIEKIEYLEKVEFTIDIAENMAKNFEEDYKCNNLKIEKYDTIKEKFVEI